MFNREIVLPRTNGQMWRPVTSFSGHLLLACLFVGVQSLSRVRLFATPWAAAHQASLSFTISRSLLRLVSIESVMPVLEPSNPVKQTPLQEAGLSTRLTTSASTQVAVLWAWQRAGASGFPRLPGKINSCSWLELWSLSQELFKTPSRLNDYNRAPPKHADIYFPFELIIYRALFIVFT